jgi:transcriptional regulator with XRE-family HTH domain
MADLVNLGNELINDIPELKPTFFSLSSALGELTFAARMEKRITQLELAKLAGVGVKTIHRIEGGSGGITDKTYDKVFAALELSGDTIAESIKKKSINRDMERELVPQY